MDYYNVAVYLKPEDAEAKVADFMRYWPSGLARVEHFSVN